ncbi:hypothetical protein [Micromonospora sp. NPDC049662]|uniref:hypothetical protein n=1 Tax=Micromonospora sp. NPDC049662 TaxID=3155397 RepID=UPI003440D621
MSQEEELVDAVRGRDHWRLDDHAAWYAPPGSRAHVRIQPVAQPTRRSRFAAAIVRDATAEHVLPCATATEAVRWAERVRLD